MFETVAVVGLGYVGLPLAIAFGRLQRTIGFDLDEARLERYRQALDPNGGISADEFTAATYLEFSSDPGCLRDADAILVAVPTPIDEAHRPDLSLLEGACRTVGANLRSGATVIFESTVFPGCTEEVCIPILEQTSGLSWLGAEGASGAGFHVGYSPERINPGDKTNRLETVVKVVAGDTAETLEKIASFYQSVVTAGVHRAVSIKVGEAAKVIENTQRDLNIALMNELSLIFNRMGIDTLDVLEAAGTKWNFLPFRPGLVGGHCIGVDPYYLTYKAETLGHHPQVILAGRQTNDGMGKFVAEQTVKKLLQSGRPVDSARVVVLGLAFKEDCPDIRNSKVVDIVTELLDYRCEVLVHDPLAEPAEALGEYGLELHPWDQLPPADALVLAVPHRQYLDMGLEKLVALLAPGGIVIDVKSRLDRTSLAAAGVPCWRL
ncbi:nucleotide sugar dehydrogenase [Seongchinamella unica]|uniref:Nucleotide sugar dehydrogenase n=1 Tax=Seongchinamella unica TaxID=2547392 RepID=A0A4R5LS57_9GAMM|nr:nucleotide sugar dehydrogenase [Seongchinamella unica]TDG13557.1 nucleotide sugar dehydrogenase [Seongchinamella unica]